MTKHHFHLIIIGLILILIDQISKIYIKTHFVLGEEVTIINHWFKIHFIENEGMAYGLKFSNGKIAKIALSLFRLIAISYGIYYLIKRIIPKKNILLNYIIIIILSGAVGNLIDSLFYDMIFNPSPTVFENGKPSILSFSLQNGYFLEGKVVDMFYFPLYKGYYPKWVPLIGGQSFEFFAYIFNFADACISIGVILFIIFNKKVVYLFNQRKD